MLHVDVKELGRIQAGAGHRITGKSLHKRHGPRRTDAEGVRRETVGREYIHIAIDDCARLAYAEVLQEENAPTVVGFLERAVQCFTRHGISVERLLTDNGSGYRSAVHAIACHRSRIRPAATPTQPLPRLIPKTTSPACRRSRRR